ncbi:MAG: leucyl aminopeptidase family protein [Lachnospiraceae bacterium]|nr:leucyl aminopeptidase family protein [Lachnospiraceae bacterium]
MKIVTGKSENGIPVRFLWEKEDAPDAIIEVPIFSGKYLDIYCETGSGTPVICMNCGKSSELEPLGVREILAVISKKCREWHIHSCNIDLNVFYERFGKTALSQAVLGLMLGRYSYSLKSFLEEYTGDKTGKETDQSCCFYITCASPEIPEDAAEALIVEAQELASDMIFARDMANTPGNHLRPADFRKYLCNFAKDTDIEVQVLEYEHLREMGMEGLCGIGESSDFPPCLVVMRYRGNPDSQETLGLFGKGVTCDTGGYCLKSSKSMAGIKGDMAGAAAVAGAMHAAAALRLKLNVTACMPICENRISSSAHLPGDVITSYSGKTVEILNTDAEGRLILADAIGYGIKDEKVSAVVDIATLTGSVWTALGYTIAGAMCNNDTLYGLFERGLQHSLERYLRFPYGREHLKLLRSNVADIKNIGGDYCGTITAGVFLKEFADGKPWLHLDIAGTAWGDPPQYAFDHPGATGAGLTSLYYLMKEWETK